MKKIALFSIGIFLTLILSAQSPEQTRKYQDAESTEILKNLQKKLSSYADISIQFTFKTEKNDKVIDEQKGTTLLKKDKYLLETPSQTIFCDGITIWNYLPEQKEVTISIYDKEDDSQMMNPMHLIHNYEKQYKSNFIRETVERGILIQIIDLTPLKSNSFYKIRIVLDKNKNQIMRFVVYDKDGTQYTYYVDKFMVNQNVSDSKFVFEVSKFPGTEVIDIR